MTEENLALKLRHSTQDSHRQAERAGVMNQLLRGTLTLESYIQLLKNLRVVYVALETGLRTQLADPMLRPFELESLLRGDALDADLRALGESPASASGVLPLTQVFATRLREMSDRPDLLVAHAYVRYLGDLNGGQTLARLVQKSFPDHAGATSFYQFGSPDDVKRRILNFRQALEKLADIDGLHDRLIKEALAAFDFYRQLFVALAEEHAVGYADRSRTPAHRFQPLTSDIKPTYFVALFTPPARSAPGTLVLLRH